MDTQGYMRMCFGITPTGYQLSQNNYWVRLFVSIIASSRFLITGAQDMEVQSGRQAFGDWTALKTLCWLQHTIPLDKYPKIPKMHPHAPKAHEFKGAALIVQELAVFWANVSIVAPCQCPLFTQYEHDKRPAGVPKTDPIAIVRVRAFCEHWMRKNI
jgi:hypothetical protein